MAQERFAEIYERRYGLHIYRTRSFNHTGIGQSSSFALPGWCRQVAEIERSGRPGVLKVGNIDIMRDFSDVRDVVRAYRMLLESSLHGEVFNVGSGKARSLREIAEFIVSRCNQEVEIVVDASLFRPSDNPVICCDRTKAESELSWVPQHDLKETLSNLYESLR